MENNNPLILIDPPIENTFSSSIVKKDPATIAQNYLALFNFDDFPLVPSVVEPSRQVNIAIFNKRGFNKSKNKIFQIMSQKFATLNRFENRGKVNIAQISVTEAEENNLFFIDEEIILEKEKLVIKRK